jgi:membrane protein DedA with SNARE-associated domain
LGAWIEAAVDWVVALVAGWGYWGVFLMMTVESSMVPFPSEVALIPAGYLVSQGQMEAGWVVACGLAGSILGALVNYGLALWLGRTAIERLGGYLWIKVEQIEAAEHYFAKHGEITTFVGRLIPVIRQLISIPAGLARMGLGRFVLYTGLGAGIWSAILVWVGYVAGQSEDVWRPLIRDATIWVLAGAAGLVVVYVLVHRSIGHRRA